MTRDTGCGMMKGTHIGILVATIVIAAGVITVRLTMFVDMDHEPIPSSSVVLAIIGQAIKTYEIEVGHLPKTLADLVTSDGSDHWPGPFLRGGIPKDPWGNDIVYVPLAGNAFQLKSLGPDGTDGTEDDITRSIQP